MSAKIDAAKKRCSGCLEYKPATIAWYESNGRDQYGGQQLRSRCRECREDVRRSSANRRKHIVSQRPGEPAYAPGPKPCKECHSLPWRVEGRECPVCRLSYADELQPELMLRRHFERAC